MKDKFRTIVEMNTLCERSLSPQLHEAWGQITKFLLAPDKENWTHAFAEPHLWDDCEVNVESGDAESWFGIATAHVDESDPLSGDLAVRHTATVKAWGGYIGGDPVPALFDWTTLEAESA